MEQPQPESYSWEDNPSYALWEHYMLEVDNGKLTFGEAMECYDEDIKQLLD